MNTAKPRKADQLSDAQLRALAEAHVRRFEYRLLGSSRMVRHDECERYLSIWRSALSKVNNSPQWRLLLSKEERQEIEDALATGEYEELLRATAERPS